MRAASRHLTGPKVNCNDGDAAALTTVTAVCLKPFDLPPLLLCLLWFCGILKTLKKWIHLFLLMVSSRSLVGLPPVSGPSWAHAMDSMPFCVIKNSSSVGASLSEFDRSGTPQAAASAPAGSPPKNSTARKQCTTAESDPPSSRWGRFAPGAALCPSHALWVACARLACRHA